MYMSKLPNKGEHQRSLDDCLHTVDGGHLDYSVNSCTLVPRYTKQAISRWKNIKLAKQIWMGAPKLIFDCGFEHQLDYRECKETAKQLTMAMSTNRSHIDPFDLHLCNLDPNVSLLEFSKFLFEFFFFN